MSVCLCVCMYGCMYVHGCTYIYIYIARQRERERERERERQRETQQNDMEQESCNLGQPRVLGLLGWEVSDYQGLSRVVWENPQPPGVGPSGLIRTPVSQK